MTTNEAAERLRFDEWQAERGGDVTQCIATRPGLIGGEHRCPRPRWKGHPTRFCYQHAISMGDARVVDQAAVDLLLAAERRATVERIREKLTAGVVHLMWKDTTDPAGRIGGHAVHLSDLDAILDEEAAR